MPLRKHSLWIDAEWYMNQNIFVIGYWAGKVSLSGKLQGKFIQHWGKQLNKYNFQKEVKRVRGYVFGYGPDVGMCEKYFRWKFRKLFHCVNLMKAFRDHIKIGSFKLAVLEVKFKLRRKVQKYKQSIMHIWRDWKDPLKKRAVLTYNKEDVINLVKLTYKIFKKYGVTKDYLKTIRLA